MLLMQMFFQCLSTLLTWLVLANVLVAVLTVRNMRRCRVELHMNSMLFFDVMNNSRTVAKITIALGTRWHLCNSLTLSCSCYDGISLLLLVQGVSSSRLAGLALTYIMTAGSHPANPPCESSPLLSNRDKEIQAVIPQQAVARIYIVLAVQLTNDSFSVMRFFEKNLHVKWHLIANLRTPAIFWVKDTRKQSRTHVGVLIISKPLLFLLRSLINLEPARCRGSLLFHFLSRPIRQCRAIFVQIPCTAQLVHQE